MRKTIILFIMIIGFMSLSSCTYVEEEIYIEDENYTMALPMVAGYKCKIVQNIEDIVIDIWYLVSKHTLQTELRNDFYKYNMDIEWIEYEEMYEKDYNGTFENEYFDYRIYTLMWKYYDKQYETSDKYIDYQWYEKAFGIDNFSTYIGSDYKLLKSYTFAEVLNKNNMPFNGEIADLNYGEDAPIHSERIYLDKENLKEEEGYLNIYIGLLSKKIENSEISKHEGALLTIRYQIEDDTITFSKY